MGGGFLMVPARIVQAGAPFLFGLAVERCGGAALWLSATLAVLAFLALAALAALAAGMNRSGDA